MNWVKLNCDGTSRGNSGYAGGGTVLRDNKGDLIIAYENYYGVDSSVYAETRAVLDGLRLAKGKNISHLWIELDYLLLVEMLNGDAAIPWFLTYIFREIHSLLPPSWYVSQVFREGNQGAKYMVNWSVDVQSSLLFENRMLLPKRLQGILLLERSGLPNVRQNDAM